MDQQETIVNRVASSSLISFELEKYYEPGERAYLDISPQLFQGLVLREKDFRQFVKSHDWAQYQGKHVGVYCSADAIIPAWAYMLVGVALMPYAATTVFGTEKELETFLFRKNLEKVDWSVYKEAKIVVKGCGNVEVPETIWLELAAKLQPVVSSLMFGEPCSTVPIFKRRQ